MAVEKKELYLIDLADGSTVNAVAQSFAECIALYGEEMIVCIRKLGPIEPEV